MNIHYLTVATYDAGSFEFDEYKIGARHQALNEWEKIKKTQALHGTAVIAAFVVSEKGAIIERWQRDGFDEIWNHRKADAPAIGAASTGTEPPAPVPAEPVAPVDETPVTNDGDGLSASLVGDEQEGDGDGA